MKIKGSDIVKRIDTLLKEKGETRKALIAVSGIKDTQTITDWNNRDNVPRADVALAIANYLNVSVRWLLTGADGAELTRDERNLLQKYGYLTKENQRNVQALIDSMLSVPGVGEKSAAG